MYFNPSAYAYLTGCVLFHAIQDLHCHNILGMEAFYMLIQMYDQVASHVCHLVFWLLKLIIYMALIFVFVFRLFVCFALYSLHM